MTALPGQVFLDTPSTCGYPADECAARSASCYLSHWRWWFWAPWPIGLAASYIYRISVGIGWSWPFGTHGAHCYWCRSWRFTPLTPSAPSAGLVSAATWGDPAS